MLYDNSLVFRLVVQRISQDRTKSNIDFQILLFIFIPILLSNVFADEIDSDPTGTLEMTIHPVLLFDCSKRNHFVAVEWVEDGEVGQDTNRLFLIFKWLIFWIFTWYDQLLRF
jgi:hypothetical protein